MKNKKIIKKIKEERGAEMLQVVLISGVLLVLIITLFYPQMQGLFTSMMDKMTNWFEQSGSKLFVI
jgi:Flp pilus assembly pilin Flp